MVLEAQIDGYDMNRVFMDGGSRLNIIFTNTLRKMLIPQSVWKTSGVMIYGVVPGEAASSLETIKLDVIFGSEGNFSRKILEFEVLDWQCEYHAILGRPAFAQFTAVPHYVYLKLNMPGPSGVITVNGKFVKSDQCDRDFHHVSDTFGAQQLLEEIAMVVDKSVFPLASKSETKEFTRDFSVDNKTVTHQVHLTDPTKKVQIYAHLPKDQATSLMVFLCEECKIFTWCPDDMPGTTRKLAICGAPIFTFYGAYGGAPQNPRH